MTPANLEEAVKSCFRIEMLPAHQGDCLWIEYGDAGRPNRILIDGGTPETHEAIRQRLSLVPAGQRQFELLIVTHIDADHIGGALKLLEETNAADYPQGSGAQEGTIRFGDIWFNGWRHLPGSGFEEFGPVQGEKLTTRLIQAGMPWNLKFNKKAVDVPGTGSLPAHTLPGGMKLTLLSPGKQELAALRPIWETECKEAGLDPAKPREQPLPAPPGFEAMGVLDIEKLANSPFAADSSVANGSSIAVLAEFDGRRALLAGDAHAGVLLESLERLAGQADRLPLDAFKLSHHGSKANLTRSLLEKIECRRYLVSSNGAQFKHPDKEAMARVIRFGGPEPELIFNYRTEFNQPWDNQQLEKKYNYRVQFPEGGAAGIVVEL